MDPVVAYRKEGMDMYLAMIDDIKYETVRMLFLARPVSETLVRRQAGKITGTSHGGMDGKAKKNVTIRKSKKIGRNDPCPCGSGKKYKKCCGRDE